MDPRLMMAEYIGTGQLPVKSADILALVDEFINTGRQIPTDVIEAGDAALQASTPPGYVMRIEPYRGRVRIHAVRV
jgi:hypothetical protein